MAGGLQRTFFALSILIFSGCLTQPGNDQKPTGRAYQGQEVEIVAPASLGLPHFWEVILQEWQSQSGAKTNIVEYDAKSSLTDNSEKTSGGRVILFPLEQICDVEAQLTALPESNPDLNSRDLFKGLRDRVMTRDRQLIAFPLSVPVLVCYYRKDLLLAARRKPPETWDEYHELIESVNSWAPGLIACEPLSPEFRATTFFARSLGYCKHPENYSVWFDIDSATPTLTSPGFREALDVSRRIWNKLPLEIVTKLNAADCRELVMKGQAAIALTYELHPLELSRQESKTSKADALGTSQRIDAIQLGICRLPGTKSAYNRNSKKWDAIPVDKIHAPALCGFAGLAAGITAPNSKRDAESGSLNLLLSLCSPALFDQAFAPLPKGPCRESQMTIAPNWFSTELTAEEASEYCDALAQSLRDPELIFELPVIGSSEFRKAAADSLEPLPREESDVERTLTAMQQAFEAIVEKHGRDAVRDSYRRGLGLSKLPGK